MLNGREVTQAILRPSIRAKWALRKFAGRWQVEGPVKIYAFDSFDQAWAFLKYKLQQQMEMFG